VIKNGDLYFFVFCLDSYAVTILPIYITFIS